MPQVYEKILIFVHKETRWFGKLVLVIQMMIFGVVLMSATVFLIEIIDLTDCLINVSALLILIEIEKVFGGLFKVHLQTYHEDLTRREDFMKIET